MFQRFQDTKMQETDESQLPTASSSELTAETAAPLYRHQQLLSYASNGDYRNGNKAFVCTATYQGTDGRQCNISKAESEDYSIEQHEPDQYSEKCLSTNKEETMFSNAVHHDVMKSTAEETETYRVNLQTTCDKFISSGLLRVAANPEKLIVEALRAPEMLDAIPCSESSSLNETDYKNILDNSQQTYSKSSEEHQYIASKQDNSLNDQLDIRLNNSVSPDDFHDISPHHHSFQDAHSRSNVDAQRMVQESLKVYFPSESQTSLDDLGSVGNRLSNELTYSVQLNDTSRTETCVNRNDISPSSNEQQINLHLNRPPSDPSQLVPENLCISEPQNQDIVDSEAVLSSVLSNRHRSTMANHLVSQLPPCDSPMPPPESPMPLHISSHMLDASLSQQSIPDHTPSSPMQHTEAMTCHQPRTLESPLPSHFHGINVRPMDSAIQEHHLYQDRESSHIYSSRVSVDTHNHARVNNSVDMLSPRALDHYNGGGSLMERVSETPMPIHGDDSSMMCTRSETPQMMVTQRQNYPLPPMRTHYDPSTHRVLQDTSHLMRDGMKYNNTGNRYINNGTMYRSDLIAHNGALTTPASLTHSPMPGDPSPSSLAQYYTTSYSPHGQQYGAYLNSDQSVERGAMIIDDNKYDRMYHDIKPFDQEYHLPMNMSHEFQPDQSMQRLPKPKKPKEPKPPRMPVVHKCKECDRLFKNSTQLKNHMWRHTGEKPFTCDQCGSKFTQQGNLRAHRRIHTGERPYQCEVCKHCFTQLSTLKTHQKIHSDERPHKCTLCDAAFRQVANLKTHQVTHTGERPHQCDLCDKAFTQKSNLKAHKNRVHNPNISYGSSGRRGRRKNPTAIKPYCCSECGAKFTMMNNLKIHMKLHTGSRDYSCDLCGAGFSQRSNLKNHIQRQHNYDRTKKVKCDECPASFRLKRCLKSHKKKRHPIKSLKIKILGESKYFMRERSGPDLSEEIDESLLEEAEEGEDRSYLLPETSLEASSESLMEMKEPKEEPHELTSTELSAEETRMKVKEEVEETCLATLPLDSKTAVSLVENFVSELDSERAASVYREESVANGSYTATNGIERIKQQLAVNLDRLTEEYKSTSTKNRLNNNDIDVSSQSANNDEREKNTTANLP